MFIRNVDYGPVWAGSGAQGFFKEGYWFHRFVPGVHDLTFVAKTVTMDPNKGNMDLDPETWRPKKMFPDCVHVNPVKGITLNSVGLSNFGLRAAIDTRKWQKIKEPFMLSFMPLRTDKITETREFVAELKPRLRGFRSSGVALQVNLSCPNTGEDLEQLTREASEILKVLQDLEIALIPKFNVLTSPEAVKRIEESVSTDALIISNTIPYGQLPERIPWERLFGKKSPLSKYKGGGGLSGHFVLPLVLEWLYAARRVGIMTNINAGGGILKREDVIAVAKAGAQSISIASAIVLRPWLLQGIIDEAHIQFYDL